MSGSTKIGRHMVAKNFVFSDNPWQSPSTFGSLLSDHLVTMGARVNPGGAMWASWPPKASFWASFIALSKVGWPIAPILRGFRCKSHSTFFFYMDPLTNDEGAISSFPKLAPLWGPNGEDVAVCTPSWVGQKGEILGGTSNNPNGPCGDYRVII